MSIVCSPSSQIFRLTEHTNLQVVAERESRMRSKDSFLQVSVWVTLFGLPFGRVLWDSQAEGQVELFWSKYAAPLFLVARKIRLNQQSLQMPLECEQAFLAEGQLFWLNYCESIVVVVVVVVKLNLLSKLTETKALFGSALCSLCPL